MAFHNKAAIPEADEDKALHRILEGTARVTGELFFAALVENLTRALDTAIAWVTEYLEPTRQLRSLAVWADDRLLPNFLMDIEGTPCEAVIRHIDLVHYPDNILEFPHDTPLAQFRAVSYMGMPLLGTDQRVLGNLAVLDTRPMPRKPRYLTILHIFAARASAELQRLNAEKDVQKREEKYRRIVETAGEGFLLLDRNGIITDVNQTFCGMVGAAREKIIGGTPPDFSTIAPDAFFLRGPARLSPKDQDFSDHYTFECSVRPVKGDEIPVLVHGNILRDDHGSIIGKMAFVTDMTSHKKSLALAAEVQRSLLPGRSFSIKGFDIDWKTVSCDEVGGDYIDTFDGGDCGSKSFSITVGDVMGHGVDAALMMMTARAFLRIHATKCQDISRLITEMNRSFTRDARQTSRFMTLFHLAIDPTLRCLRWVRAGHEPAVVFHPFENRFEELKGPGMALGLDENYIYQESLLTDLRAGQIIAVGTDGIWETRNTAGEMYGKERFCQVIRRYSHLRAEGIIKAVFADVNSYMAGRKRDDDITLVVIKVDAFPEADMDFQI
ncbi:PP2C family protein-serine/threonine phosphatase [Desulfococcus sp.]|uniref:PP2C family protein-serine/threonine phosphatase n=1 Tax=Desulfococcus sp. TaxID=2025834 RepID=UPI003593CCB9